MFRDLVSPTGSSHPQLIGTLHHAPFTQGHTTNVVRPASVASPFQSNRHPGVIYQASTRLNDMEPWTGAPGHGHYLASTQQGQGVIFQPPRQGVPFSPPPPGVQLQPPQQGVGVQFQQAQQGVQFQERQQGVQLQLLRQDLPYSPAQQGVRFQMSHQGVQSQPPQQAVQFGAPSQAVQFQPPQQASPLAPSAIAVQSQFPQQAVHFGLPPPAGQFQQPQQATQFRPPSPAVQFQQPQQATQFRPPPQSVQLQQTQQGVQSQPPQQQTRHHTLLINDPQQEFEKQQLQQRIRELERGLGDARARLAESEEARAELENRVQSLAASNATLPNQRNQSGDVVEEGWNDGNAHEGGWGGLDREYEHRRLSHAHVTFLPAPQTKKAPRLATGVWPYFSKLRNKKK